MVGGGPGQTQGVGPTRLGVGLHLGRAGSAAWVRMGDSPDPFLFVVLGGVPSMAASLTPQSPSRVGVRPLESEPGPRACPHLGALGRLDPGTGREWRCRRECGSEGLAGPGRARAPAARRGNTGWLFRTRAAHGPRENVRGQLRPACGTLALPPGVAAARGGRASLAAGGRAVQADPPEGRQVPTLPHVVWGYSGWGTVPESPAPPCLSCGAGVAAAGREMAQSLLTPAVPFPAHCPWAWSLHCPCLESRGTRPADSVWVSSGR